MRAWWTRGRTRLWCAMLVGAVLTPTLAAYAHTRVDWSSPTSGAHVTEPLREVRVRFSQPVEAEYTTLELIGPAGAVASGPTRAEPGSGRQEFVLPIMGALTPGEHTVRWKTTSADGHVLNGSFSFVLDARAVPADRALPPAAETPAPSVPDASPAMVAGFVEPEAPLAVAARFLHFASLLILVGVAAFSLLVLPPALRPESRQVAESGRRRARALALAALALLAVATVARLWIQSAALHGVGEALSPDRLVSLLGGTSWGRAWSIQIALLIAAAVGLALQGPKRRGWLWVAAASTLGLALIPALTGHAAAVERQSLVAIVSDVLHVLGAGVWLGTLAVVLVAGIPAAVSVLPAGERAAGVAEMVARFSPVALVGGGLAGATGVVSALFHLSSVAQLWSMAYGQTLLLKLGLLGIVAVLGFYHWRFVVPHLGTEAATLRLKRTAWLEIALGAAVVLVTAVLVALPTPP